MAIPIKAFFRKGFLEKTVRNSPKLAAVIDRTFRKRVIGLKGATLKDFDRHPVTRELKQGPDGINLSLTLGGVGNLFSFIGFYSTDDPIGPVRDVLKSYLNLSGRQRKIKGRMGVKAYRYSLTFPTLGAFDVAGKMPWEIGNSWVKGIEKGISGFSNYMYFRSGEGRFLKEKSRSGKALQSRREVNIGFFKPTKYISEILDKYRKRLA